MEKSINLSELFGSGLDVQNSNGTVNAQAIYSGEIVCAHPNVLKFGQILLLLVVPLTTVGGIAINKFARQ